MTRPPDLSLSRPDISAREIALVNEVLRSPQLSIGPYLERFEQAVAEFVGARHAVGVSSGTAGLHMAVAALGLGEGDEVITTPFSFVASANCLLYERARPVFVDVDPDTLNLDLALVERALTPRTRALLPVHVFGLPCPMDGLMALAGRHGLEVIEDACEALGARWAGRAAGTFGACGVYAFYPNKQLTTGEGGMLVTDRDDLARVFRSLRNQGRDDAGTWLRHVRLGYNYRLSELAAALGVGQMERIDDLLARRARVAARYEARLAGRAGIATPPRVARAETSWFVYVVRLPAAADRARVIERLAADGVPARAYFPVIHLQPFYAERFGYRPGAFPVAEAAAGRTLALPFHGALTDDAIDHVAERLVEAVTVGA